MQNQLGLKSIEDGSDFLHLETVIKMAKRLGLDLAGFGVTNSYKEKGLVRPLENFIVSLYKKRFE